MNGHMEAPYFTERYFTPGNSISEEMYSQGRLNGHKYAAYIYDIKALKNLYKSNSNIWFLVCIRDTRESLLSWQKMHKAIAERGQPENHFVNNSRLNRNFYKSCTIEEYYNTFARTRLRYSRYIDKMINTAPNARVVIISQSYLANHAKKAIGRLHNLMGLEPSDSYLNLLPSEAHVSVQGERLGESALPDWIMRELGHENESLTELISQLRHTLVS